MISYIAGYFFYCSILTEDFQHFLFFADKSQQQKLIFV